jgi:anti-sigma factor RsiW
MSCTEPPEEDLVAWLDGELAPADAARVAAHLRGCGVCRREAAALRESGAMLERLPTLEPPADFVSRVVAAARDSSSTVAETPRGRLHLLRRSVAAAAVAAVLMVAAGVWWSSSGGDVLSAGEAEAIARDLALLSNLEVLETSEASEIARVVDDLDVLDAYFTEEAEDQGG